MPTKTTHCYRVDARGATNPAQVAAAVRSAMSKVVRQEEANAIFKVRLTAAEREAFCAVVDNFSDGHWPLVEEKDRVPSRVMIHQFVCEARDEFRGKDDKSVDWEVFSSFHWFAVWDIATFYCYLLGKWILASMPADGQVSQKEQGQIECLKCMRAISAKIAPFLPDTLKYKAAEF